MFDRVHYEAATRILAATVNGRYSDASEEDSVSNSRSKPSAEFLGLLANHHVLYGALLRQYGASGTVPPSTEED